MPGCSFLGEWASEITFQQGDNKCIILKFDMLSYVPSTLFTVNLVVIFLKSFHHQQDLQNKLG